MARILNGCAVQFKPDGGSMGRQSTGHMANHSSFRQNNATARRSWGFGAQKPTQTKASESLFRSMSGNEPSPPSFQQAWDAKAQPNRQL
jgi:hypothetical protein